MVFQPLNYVAVYSNIIITTNCNVVYLFSIGILLAPPVMRLPMLCHASSAALGGCRPGRHARGHDAQGWVMPSIEMQGILYPLYYYATMRDIGLIVRIANNCATELISQSDTLCNRYCRAHSPAQRLSLTTAAGWPLATTTTIPAPFPEMCGTHGLYVTRPDCSPPAPPRAH